MEYGTGWLGWTEAETLDTSMPVIVLAYHAHLDKLCFAAGRKPPERKNARPKGPPVTTKDIAAMFGNR